MRFKIFIQVDAVTNVDIIKDNQKTTYESVTNHTVEGLLDFDFRTFELRNLVVKDRYQIEFDKKKTLTGALLPYLYPETSEEIAEEFLRLFYPKALMEPQAVDPQLVIDVLRLNIVEKPLSHHGRDLAKYLPLGGETRYYNPAKNRYQTIFLNRRTIVVDSKLKFFRNRHHTLFHEILHDYNQAPYRALREYLELEEDAEQFTEEFLKSASWAEKYCEIIAPKILMPKEMFLKQENLFLIESISQSSTTGFLDAMEQVIKRLSDFFKVSVQSVRIRLIELGRTEVRGILEYVDGRYLPSFGFSGIKVGSKQTLTLSKSEYVRLLEVNQEFTAIVNEEQYLFLEGHLVLNHPKVIHWSAEGPCIRSNARECLSDYALIFDIENDNSTITIEEWESSVLYRKYDGVVSYRKEYNSQYKTDIERLAAEEEELKREEELEQSLSGNYIECMERIKAYQECTYEEIAENVGCADKTIKRLFLEKKGSIQTFVFTMIYLQMPYAICQHIQNIAPKFAIDLSETGHSIYRQLLMQTKSWTVEEAKNYLIYKKISIKIKD